MDIPSVDLLQCEQFKWDLLTLTFLTNTLLPPLSISSFNFCVSKPLLLVNMIFLNVEGVHSLSKKHVDISVMGTALLAGHKLQTR